jgi:hypothetical protein
MKIGFQNQNQHFFLQKLDPKNRFPVLFLCETKIKIGTMMCIYILNNRG